MSARAAPIRSTDTIVRSIGLSSSVNLLILAPGEETVKALVAYRLLAPGSEWRLHREWFQQRFGRSAGRGCRARRDPQTVPTSTAASAPSFEPVSQQTLPWRKTDSNPRSLSEGKCWNGRTSRRGGSFFRGD